MKCAVIGIVLGVSLLTRQGLAADLVADCTDAADRGQEARDKGRLQSARERFTSCARETCPAEVAKACRAWLADVVARQPTVVVQVVDASERDRTDARVTIDGAASDAHVTGTAVIVDPGVHDLRATVGMLWATERFVAREREHGRAIRLVLADPPNPPAGTNAEPARREARRGGGPPLVSWVFGSVGILSLGAFTVLGLDGAATTRRLEATCARPCNDPAIDATRREFLVADLALGVGIVALAAGAVLWFRDAHR